MIVGLCFFQARKALHALRGLVKLQALVRGHLVRKQTTATLRRMHALMAIQVRARVQRVQMAAEEAQLVVKTQSSFHKGFVPESGVRAVHRDRVSLTYSASFLQILLFELRFSCFNSHNKNTIRFKVMVFCFAPIFLLTKHDILNG